MRERSRMLRFAAVGTVGFLVDGGLLQLLVGGLGSGPIVARTVSFPMAVLVTWALNRSMTFRSDARGVRALAASFGRYLLVSIGGTAVNFAAYCLLVLGFERFRDVPIVPLAVASVIAMAFNYLGAKHIAFRQTIR